jgi:hypothetical protein
MGQDLLDAAWEADVEAVKSLLTENPSLDINWKNEDAITALHVACNNGHDAVVSLLVAHPKINLNQQDNGGSTPFLRACTTGRVSCVCVLLRDGRTDINLADENQCSPLWYASCFGRLDVVKWIIASGRAVDLILKGEWVGKEYTPLEIAKENFEHDVAALLERFQADPAATRQAVRQELGWHDCASGDLYALVVFLCDGLLHIQPGQETSQPARFLAIAFRLPMELQAVLCHRVFGSPEHTIVSADAEIAFRHLAAHYAASM